MYKYFRFFLWFSICAGCGPYDLEKLDFPEALTLDFQMGANPTQAILNGEVQGFAHDNQADQHGHIWGTDPEKLVLGSLSFRTELGAKSNSPFISKINNLTPGRTYYYRAYLEVEGEVLYGAPRPLTVSNIEINFSTLLNCNNISLTATVDVAGIFPDFEESFTASRYGLVWSGSDDPKVETDQSTSIAQNTLIDGALNFKSDIFLRAGLNYVRPYLQIEDTIYYGATDCCLINNTWSSIGGFPGRPRMDAVGFAIGNVGYVGLGETNQLAFLKDFWAYDTRANKWRQIADFPGEARKGAVAFVSRGKGYVGTGFSDFGFKKDFWCYDPQEDTWMEIEALPGPARTNSISWAIDDIGYIGTGYTNLFRSLADFWFYDPDRKTWVEITKVFPGKARANAVSFAMDSKGYLLFGVNNPGASQIDDMWTYDTRSKEWEEIPVQVDPRGFASGFSNDLHGFIVGGTRQFSAVKEFWRFNPQSGNWLGLQQFASFPRQKATTFVIGNDRAYVCFGENDNLILLSDIWSYYIGDAADCPQ